MIHTPSIASSEPKVTLTKDGDLTIGNSHYKVDNFTFRGRKLSQLNKSEMKQVAKMIAKIFKNSDADPQNLSFFKLTSSGKKEVTLKTKSRVDETKEERFVKKGRVKTKWANTAITALGSKPNRTLPKLIKRLRSAPVPARLSLPKNAVKSFAKGARSAAKRLKNIDLKMASRARHFQLAIVDIVRESTLSSIRAAVGVVGVSLGLARAGGRCSLFLLGGIFGFVPYVIAQKTGVGQEKSRKALESLKEFTKTGLKKDVFFTAKAFLIMMTGTFRCVSAAAGLILRPIKNTRDPAGKLGVLFIRMHANLGRFSHQPADMVKWKSMHKVNYMELKDAKVEFTPTEIREELKKEADAGHSPKASTPSTWKSMALFFLFAQTHIQQSAKIIKKLDLKGRVKAPPSAAVAKNS